MGLSRVARLVDAELSRRGKLTPVSDMRAIDVEWWQAVIDAPMLCYAPPEYVKASPELRNEICNGCGSARSKFDFVPDTIWGLSISEACNIHDWMYHWGRTIEDKEEADRVFLNNLLRIIKKRSANKFIMFLREQRAMKYYSAVNLKGGPAFWDGKV